MRAAAGRVLPFTRFVVGFDLVGLLLATAGLSLVPERTDRFFAWTIALPLSAAVLGAAYVAALPSGVLALLGGEWRRIRILLVAGLSLTAFILVATVRDLHLFHLHSGSLTARGEAWIWVVAYMLLPPLNLLAWAVQERADPNRTRQPHRPLLQATRLAFAVFAAVMAVFGVGLLFALGTFHGVWPWKLTRLSGGALGAWLIAVAVTMGWALHDDDWDRVRLLAPFFPLYFALQLVAAARTSDGLDAGDPKTWAWVAAVAGSAALFATLVWREERAGPEARGRVRPSRARGPDA